MVVLRLGIEEQKDREQTTGCGLQRKTACCCCCGCELWWGGGGVGIPWRITSLLGPR